MGIERELLERVLLNRYIIPIQIIYDINELLAQPERDFIGEIQYLTDCLMEAEEKVSKLLAQPEQEQELRVSVWLPFKKKEHGIGEDND